MSLAVKRETKRKSVPKENPEQVFRRLKADIHKRFRKGKAKKMQQRFKHGTGGGGGF